MYPLHPITGEYADFTEAELTALRESLCKHGLLVPILIWRGQIVDGRHRERLCEELGIDLRTCDITDKCKTEEDMIACVRALNEHRRANTKPLTNAEKRARIEAALRAKPKMSNLAIAKTLGVDDKTVASVRAVLDGRSEIPNVTCGNSRVDTRGRRQPARKPKFPVPSPKHKPVEPFPNVLQSGIFPSAATVLSEVPEGQAPTSASPEQKPLESTAKLEMANTPPREALPLAATPVRSPDLFDTIEAEIDRLLPVWLVSAENVLSTVEIMERDPLLQLVRRLKAVHDRAASWETKSHLARQEGPWRRMYEIRWRAARKAGRLLIESLKAGLRTNGRPDPKKQIGTPTDFLSLEDLNIISVESCRWKGLARLTDKEFEVRLARGINPCDGYQKQTEPWPTTARREDFAPDAAQEQRPEDDAEPIEPSPSAQPDDEPVAATVVTPARGTADDGLDIPEFLRRAMVPAPAEQVLDTAEEERPEDRTDISKRLAAPQPATEQTIRSGAV